MNLYVLFTDSNLALSEYRSRVTAALTLSMRGRYDVERTLNEM
jgi:hypothetical protein